MSTVLEGEQVDAGGPEWAEADPARGGAPLLKPRCALEVAVVGNRRFAGENAEAPNQPALRMTAHAAAACEAVWQTVLESMSSALEEPLDLPATRLRAPNGGGTRPRLKDFFSAEPPRLGVLSSLAAGGDQAGARTALEAGDERADVAVELEAILPFAEADYPGGEREPRPEFRPAEARLLTELAARARQVVRLDGRYDDDEGRHRAYEHARDLLLQNADLLVAIYDPLADGARAGTVETVQLALAAHLPVIAVLVAPNEARIAVIPPGAEHPVTGERLWNHAVPVADDGWRAPAAQQIRGLLALPHQRAAPGETPDQRRGRLALLRDYAARLRLVYGESPTHRMCRGAIRQAFFDGAWRFVLWLGDVFTRDRGNGEHASAPDRAADEITVQPYARFYDRASELSGVYMRTYRGAFVLSFLLAGVAVAAAVLLMAIALLSEEGKPPVLAIYGLGGSKIGIISLLLILERASHQERYQEHATDFRYLAELLRPMQWLAPLGAAAPAVELPVHFAPLDPRGGWTQWLYRAIARATPTVAVPAADGDVACPREVVLDGRVARAGLERARSEWIQGQAFYHWHNARRMHGIDHGLERAAKLLLWLVLGGASIALGLKIIPNPLPDWLATVLGATSAILPAFIAALGGIMFQSEARRLKLRSEAMFHELLERQRELERLGALVERAGPPHDDVAWFAAQHLRSLAAVMIAETGDWKVLYQTHEIHAG